MSDILRNVSRFSLWSQNDFIFLSRYIKKKSSWQKQRHGDPFFCIYMLQHRWRHFVKQSSNLHYKGPAEDARSEMTSLSQKKRCSYPRLLNMASKSSSSQVGDSTRRPDSQTADENCWSPLLMSYKLTVRLDGTLTHKAVNTFCGVSRAKYANCCFSQAMSRVHPFTVPRIKKS